MKFRLSVFEEHYVPLKDYLDEHNVETGEDADFMITETTQGSGFLSARDSRKEPVRVSVDDVIFIEAFGKDIEIHTPDGTYISQDRMYRLETMLDHREFLRISKSVIISRKHVKKIRPSLSMKYILTLSDSTIVDVTRSYYSEFRKFFGI